MEQFQQILQPSYLIFVLPFFGALFYFMLMALGFAFEGHDIDVDYDVDAGGIEIGHDLGVEHSTEFGGHDHDFDHAHEPSHLMKALSFLGFGKVPVSIVVVSFCFLWGFTGYAANRMFENVLPGWLYVWPSLATALLSACLGTNMLARIISRVMPSTETYGVSNAELVGQRADVRFKVTATAGTITLHDRQGNFRQLPARSQMEGVEIPSGTKVVIVRYDRVEQACLVAIDQLPT